jgi:glutamine amidotransferase
MIAVIDYGAGNLHSVENALAALDASYELVREPASLARASRILLPGVGHFGQMMRSLDNLRLRSTLAERIGSGVPFLGICLGLQALFARSEEAPEAEGLGLFPECVLRFPPGSRVPHMGWNQVTSGGASPLFEGLPPEPYFYFAHSFYVPPVAATAASAGYGQPFTAVLASGNVYGVQFHPEKSGSGGLRLLKNFLELPC